MGAWGRGVGGGWWGVGGGVRKERERGGWGRGEGGEGGNCVFLYYTTNRVWVLEAGGVGRRKRKKTLARCNSWVVDIVKESHGRLG